jgi:hypothetical protein
MGAPMAVRSRTLVYGIGAQKAATTWLYGQLQAQPGVSLPFTKEVHYWNTWRSPAMDQVRARAELEFSKLDRRFGRTWLRRHVSAEARAHHEAMRNYRDLLGIYDPTHGRYLDYLHRGAADGDLIADITPAYSLLSRRTFAEMAALHPDPKFLFIMRDPVERLISGIRQQNLNRLRLSDLSAEAEADLLDRALADAVAVPHDPNRARSNYRWTIEELEAAVPPECIHYGFFESMFSTDATGELCTFLGLGSFVPETAKRVNTAKSSRYTPPADLVDAAYRALAPVYAFVRSKFGHRVPAAWRE